MTNILKDMQDYNISVSIMAVSCDEIVNVEYAKYLSSLTLSDFKKIYPNAKDVKSLHSLLVKTCKQFLTHNPYKRKFEFSKGKTYGRRQSVDGGIQGLPKVCRGALCKDITTDIDMVNCHPRLLLSILGQRNIPCPHLREYCANRNTVLESLYESDGFSKDHAKEAFLRAINKGGKCVSKGDPKRNTFFKAFDREMKAIQETLWTRDEFAYIKSDADHEKGNPLGSFLNLILCRYENDILELVINWLQDQSYEPSTLCFDGLLVKGNHYDNGGLIESLNSLTSDWDIQWAFKAHDTTLTIPDDFIYGDTQEDLTEKEYADIFCDQYKGQVVRGLSKSYVLNQHGIYIHTKNPKEFIRAKLLNEYQHYKFLQKDKNLNAVTNIINTLIFDDTTDERMDKATHLLPFINGVFDLETREFRNALPSEYVSRVINYEFRLIDFSDLEELFRSLFEEDAREYAMWKLGNILNGSNKTFTAMIGSGSNGKTKVVAKSLQSALDSFYLSIDTNLVKADKNKLDSDEKPKPEVLSMKHSMLNMVNELPKGIKLSSSKIKTYTGGNELRVRTLHSDEFHNFQVKGQVFIDTNTLGEFDEVDDPIKNRLEVLPFPYTFVDTSKRPVNPNNPYERPMVKDVLPAEYGLKCMNLMLYYYYQPKPELPQSISVAHDALIHEIDDVAKFLSICKQGNAYKCEGRNLYNAYKDQGGELTFKDFKVRMEHRGYAYKKVKISGVSVYGYQGVSFAQYEDTDEVG